MKHLITVGALGIVAAWAIGRGIQSAVDFREREAASRVNQHLLEDAKREDVRVMEQVRNAFRAEWPGIPSCLSGTGWFHDESGFQRRNWVDFDFSNQPSVSREDMEMIADRLAALPVVAEWRKGGRNQDQRREARFGVMGDGDPGKYRLRVDFQTSGGRMSDVDMVLH